MNKNDSEDKSSKRKREEDEETSDLLPIRKHKRCEISQVIEIECQSCFDYYFSESRKDYRKEYLPKFLHLVCEKQKYELLKKVCSFPDSPDKAELFNYVLKVKTPLQTCVEINDIKAIDMLLRQPLVDIFKVPKGGISPFQAALEQQLKIPTIQVDAAKYIDSDKENNEELERCDYKDFLVDAEGPQAKSSVTPFKLLLFKLNSIIKSITSANDYLDTTTITYKYFLNLMKIYSQCLIKTIDTQNYNALHLMLSTGISYKKISEFPEFSLPVFAAVYKGDVNIIKMLIDHNTNFALTKKFNQIPIHILAAKGFLTSLKLIISKYYLSPSSSEQDVIKLNNLQNLGNEQNSDSKKWTSEYIFQQTLDTKMTVLHFAALNNNPNTLSYLLQLNNAFDYINQRNKNGSTPLLCSSSKGNVECLKILLEQEQTDILIGDLHGNTPIVYATYYNREGCAHEILAAISKKLRLLSKQRNNNYNHEDQIMDDNCIIPDDTKAESYLIEKRKWFILSTIDSTREQNKVVELKAFQEGKEMEILFENLQKIWEFFDLSGIGVSSEKIPTLEIKINGFERGSGVLRQWLKDASDLFASKYIFRSLFDYRELQVDYSAFNVSPEEYNLYLPYYEFLDQEDEENMKMFGLFLAIAFLYNPVFLPISPIFFKILMDKEPTLKDILPADTLENLRKMRTFTDDQFDNLCLTMSVKSFCNGDQEAKVFPLKAGGEGILVNSSNFTEYEDLLLKFYTTEGQREKLLNSFREGFFRYLEREKFKQLTFKELLLMTLKKQDYIKVENWKPFTKLVHSENKEPQVFEWFWEYVSKCDLTKQRKLFEFACGSPVLPLGNFRTLYEDSHPFTLQFAPNVIDGLPWAFTCTYTLHLPFYSSKELLEAKFDLALASFKGFQFV